MNRDLIGRAVERERVERLVADAHAGGGGVLLLHGDPGIGRTSLLLHARAVAADRLRVLSARGVETESELPFAGLWDLLGPVLELRDRLPPAQAAALGQALALEATGTPPRFAVPAALLGLLGAAAGDGPLLVLVDDVQWLDEPSIEAVLFAARRLRAEGIAMLLAVRDGAGRRVDAGGIPSLRLEALGAADAEDLLRRTHGERLGSSVAAGLVEQAAGNPLALVELPRVLTEAQLAGRDALPPVLPAGQSLEAAFRAQLAGLPEDARRALVVAAAASGGEGLAHVRAAIERAGPAATALDAAEQAGVVAVEGGELRFRHPLLRASAYHAAAPAERRAAHRALADSAPDGDPARAWHLAASIGAADETVARDLEAAAGDARRRGGHAAAARAYARAADLTPDPAERARRLLEAALDDVAAGLLEQAVADAEAALPLAEDPLLRTGLERIRAHVRIRSGRPEAGVAAMARAAGAMRADLPQLAATMLLEASLGCLLTGTFRDVMGHAREVRALSGGLEVLDAIADVLVAQAWIAGGDPGRAWAVLAPRAAWLAEVEPPPGASEALAAGGHAAMWLERFDLAGRILDRLVDAARGEGALARLTYPLTIRAQVAFRRGSWNEAYAGAEEAARASRETGQVSSVAYATQMLAEIEAGLGRFDEARAHAAEAIRIGTETESPVFGPYARAALGAVAALEGDAEAAVAEYGRARADLQAIGMPAPGDLLWTAELVELHAGAGAGDDEQARSELAVLERLVTEGHPPVHQAQLRRCRALVAGGEEADALLEEAMAWHRRSDTPLERARTELALGARLRRGGAKGDARGPLRGALETFERLGSRPWADRARTELRAAGGASGRETVPVAEALSPHELQVALVVARGATNKEAAAQLFVSPKTVEHHLGHIYRKLDLRSRTELSALLSGQTADLP